MNGIAIGKGFTLVELMVSVSVISIITAIAVPNFMRSRMSANETAAIAGLRAIAAAQEMYRRTDYDSDGVLEYAYNWELTETWGPDANGMWVPKRLGLIDSSIANADRWWSPLLAWGATTHPKAGYWYNQIWGYWDPANWANSEWFGVWLPNKGQWGAWVLSGYGAAATPATYDTTGTNLYIIDHQGRIWFKDAMLESDYVQWQSLSYIPTKHNLRNFGYILLD